VAQSAGQAFLPKIVYPDPEMSPQSTDNFPILPSLDAAGNPSASETAGAPAGNGTPAGQFLFGLDAAALSVLMKALGEPCFRARQIAEALYHQRIATLDAITTLPRALRERMAAAGWQSGLPRIAQVFQSVDGTERYLIETLSGARETVETVWMPEGDHCVGQTEAERAGQGRTEAEQAALERTEAEQAALGRTEAEQAALERTEAEQDFGDQPEVYWENGQLRHQATICVSSQVGCAVNCQFCLTARLGWQKNLTAGEIAGQVVAVMARHGVDVGRDRLNLVFMGMGEPFLNYDNFMAAVRLLVQEVGLSPRRMTVSTSGIVPGIARFAQEPAAIRPKLAISLNAPNDAVRAEIMPINRKWPIEAVLEAVKRIPLRPKERVTFEYVLLGGVTDREEHAREVARLLRRSGLPAKVNLIAWNSGPGVAFQTPDESAVERFRRQLQDSGIPAFLRKPRGRDIYAACGQLKRTMES
jgi:23S rRNA (adenine2503-C2)-methyltransferase